MNTALISVGSNINPNENIEKAKSFIAQEFQLLACSQNLITKPIGFSNQPDFTNAIFCIKTGKKISDFKLILRDIENRLGRVRTENRNGPRTIDLDIVVWNAEIIDDDVYIRDFLRKLIVEVAPEMKERLESKEINGAEN